MSLTNRIADYTDRQVILAIAKLIDGRDQSNNPITQSDISVEARVPLRTVHNSLDRLMETGVIISPDRQQGRPATYSLSPQALAIVEERNARLPDCA